MPHLRHLGPESAKIPVNSLPSLREWFPVAEVADVGSCTCACICTD
ncbi:MAG: hypothetical protein QGF03_00690 [SAR324 cluster bacterium]|nr:hypothetical protein [SAR324 cluster bacterium]